MASHVTDIYTTKYAAADGSLLWERRYSGSSGLDDAPIALTIDAAGNVLMTGWSVRNSVEVALTNCYLAKYAATDGAMLWEISFSGDGTGDYRPAALAVDSTQNIVLTRTNRPPEMVGDPSWQVIKYQSSDGAVLWEHTQPGEALDLQVNPGGPIIALGKSNNKTHLINFSEATGLVNWEKDEALNPYIPPQIRIIPTQSVLLNIQTSHYPIVHNFNISDGRLLWKTPTEDDLYLYNVYHPATVGLSPFGPSNYGIRNDCGHPRPLCL